MSRGERSLELGKLFLKKFIYFYLCLQVVTLSPSKQNAMDRSPARLISSEYGLGIQSSI